MLQDFWPGIPRFTSECWDVDESMKWFHFKVKIFSPKQIGRVISTTKKLPPGTSQHHLTHLDLVDDVDLACGRSAKTFKTKTGCQKTEWCIDTKWGVIQNIQYFHRYDVCTLKMNISNIQWYRMTLILLDMQNIIYTSYKSYTIGYADTIPYHTIRFIYPNLAGTVSNSIIFTFKSSNWSSQRFYQLTNENTVGGKNPAHQLRLVVYAVICKVLYIPGGCLGSLPSTVSSRFTHVSKNPPFSAPWLCSTIIGPR